MMSIFFSANSKCNVQLFTHENSVGENFTIFLFLNNDSKTVNPSILIISKTIKDNFKNLPHNQFQIFSSL